MLRFGTTGIVWLEGTRMAPFDCFSTQANPHEQSEALMAFDSSSISHQTRVNLP